MADSGNGNGDSEDSDSEDQVQYQFKIEEDKWREWKLGVRRDKSLRERIIELIEEDTGRGA